MTNFLRLPVSAASQLSPTSEPSKPLSVDRSQHDVLLNDILHLSQRGSLLPIPIQPGPVLTPQDRAPRGLERVETVLDGEIISCFNVGGEKRLCFPQVLNAVLREVSLGEINKACMDLNIHCSQCSQEQLEVLKVTAVLPMSASSCGLITKSDAERLTNYILQSKKPRIRLPAVRAEVDKIGIPVSHDCFGGAKGLLLVNLYRSPSAECIECLECGDVLAMDKFVVHSHHPGAECKTCHWGFDTANWRAYVHLSPEVEDKTELKELLDILKFRFDSLPLLPPDPRLILKRKPQEEISMNSEAKKPRLETPAYVLYDPTLLTMYQQTLLRCQALLTASLPGLPSASPLLRPTTLGLLQSAQPTPTSTSAAKAALAAAGLLALAEADSPDKKPPKKEAVKDTGAQVVSKEGSPLRCSETKDEDRGHQRLEPPKKHLLHQFEEQQRRVLASTSLESPSSSSDPEPLAPIPRQRRDTEDSRSTSSASESGEEDLSLDRLLKKHVKGKEVLRKIRAKIAGSQKSLETKIDSLSAHNQILQQEIAYLRNKQSSSSILKNGALLLSSH